MTPDRDPSRAYAEFVKGLWKENPVFVAVLGMCPTLAVTNTGINAVAMAAAGERAEVTPRQHPGSNGISINFWAAKAARKRLKSCRSS